MEEATAQLAPREKPGLEKCHSWASLVAFFVGCFLLWSSGSATAEAASIYFSPRSGTYTVGQNFSVTVIASSADEAANAFSGKIDFPADKLSVTSLSKSGTVVSLWVQEPSFSNGDGSINFEGIALNPGFTGSAGKILTINFKVKAVGEGVLDFTSGSVLANDGQGTNILSGLGRASFDLTVTGGGPTAERTTTPTEGLGTLPAPAVTSPDVSDPNKWYNQKNLVFNWILPGAANGVSFGFDKISVANPGPVSDGRVSTRTYTAVDDGVWYFHIRLRNSAGWGSIAHFRVQLDSKPPEPFTVTLGNSAGATSSLVTVRAQAHDALSGVGYYRVKIDNGEVAIVAPKDIETTPYTLSVVSPGKHTVIVQAVDKAENAATASADFTTQSLLPPEFTEYARELQRGDILIARGKTYPNAPVTVWIQHDNDDIQIATVRSDTVGNFSFINVERVKSGLYRLSAEVSNGQGLKSDRSVPITIGVEQSFWWRLVASLLSYFSFLVPLIALLILLALFLFKSWHKFMILKKQLRQEVREVEDDLHEAFDRLREDVREQIRLLEKTKTKRNLTEQEEKIIKQLRTDLDTAEKSVKKKIQRIEEEIK